ncbi:MAG: Holliday junction resolvase Hjc [Sulfolobales archaeon]|nr:Holliday junction resolvase Hjc [Sulfolobales archaeon]MCX8208802.1 Holliday junction resolvase Hjc [Sulfolobales archaeon]MDW8011061.1 Holliday junction resolvase Hjc [Sulfolobales archaeon]
MSRGSRSRGYRAERELVAQLWRRGFAVMRAPASGSKVKRAHYPDVVAIKNGRVAVFEVKSRSKEGNIYIEEEQIAKLVEFAARAGGKAFVAVKLPRQDWAFVPVERLELTSSGYRIRRDILSDSLNLDQLEVLLGLRSTLLEYVKTSEEIK